jgi:DNA-binding XRE family transcriptional regulator
MSSAEATLEGSQRLTARQAALADIAERRSQDPNWSPRTDPTYSGTEPAFIQLMSDAEYDRHMAGSSERRQLASNPYPPIGSGERIELPMSRRVVRAALPLGQRIRDVRRALRWTQRDVALELGVSRRSIIRYEQGRSAPLQSAPLLALRRLESTHAHLITK